MEMLIALWIVVIGCDAAVTFMRFYWLAPNLKEGLSYWGKEWDLFYLKMHCFWCHLRFGCDALLLGMVGFSVFTGFWISAVVAFALLYYQSKNWAALRKSLKDTQAVIDEMEQ